MRKKIGFSMLAFFVLGAVFFAQSSPPQRLPPPRTESRNFNGRKMPRRTENFSLIGVKIESAGDMLTCSLFLNAPVNANSVQAESIFIDDEPLPRKTEFLFNKTRHMARFSVPKTDGTFSLKITALRSFDGKPMNPTEITNAEANSFFRYDRKEKTWQKSSL